MRFNTFGLLFVGLSTKDRVYPNNPQTLEQLKTNIREVLTEVLPEMCPKVI